LEVFIMTLLSYHNDPALKLKYQQRFESHRLQDEVIQGIGFEDNKGCFVGCTLNDYNHKQFEVELGWPEWLAILADSIFEGLPKGDAPQFGTDLLEAVPVGVDLDPVKWKLAIWRHEKQVEQLRDSQESYAEEVCKAVQLVIDYCKDKLRGQKTEEELEEQRKKAESAAESARSAARSAECAARSAARSARSVWSAAESAAWSAYWSAESAAVSAARSVWPARSVWSAAWAARSARSAYWSLERDILLKLVRECGRT
jgi:hypothetical protein